MLVTSSSGGSDDGKNDDVPEVNGSATLNSNERDHSESDSRLHNVITISQDPSAFQTRQALGKFKVFILLPSRLDRLWVSLKSLYYCLSD